MADAQDLKSCDSNIVRVQVPPRPFVLCEDGVEPLEGSQRETDWFPFGGDSGMNANEHSCSARGAEGPMESEAP